MRKVLFVIAVLYVTTMVGLAYADQSSVSPAGYTYPPVSYQGVVTLSGKPGATKNITLIDNTVGSLPALFATAGGTFFLSNVTPIGAWISCLVKSTTWAFGGTTATGTVGHVLAAGTWLHLTNPTAVATASIFGFTGDNVVCTVTLEY